MIDIKQKINTNIAYKKKYDQKYNLYQGGWNNGCIVNSV